MAALVIQPVQEKEFERWVEKRLKHLLGVEQVTKIVQQLLSFNSSSEVEIYAHNVLGTGRQAVEKFIGDFISKKLQYSPIFRVTQQRAVIDQPNDMLTYRKGDDDDLASNMSRKQSRKALRQDTTPQATQPQRQRPKKQRAHKHDLKDIAADAMKMPGRNLCTCQAARHKLVGNCMDCGKIICEQEGPGPCLFCGYTSSYLPVYTDAVSLPSERPSEGGGADDEALAVAISKKDTLLQYERTSAQRTIVYDDQQDYFSTDASKWLSAEEKAKLQKAHVELERRKEEAKKPRITFDFAGRRVVSTQDDFDNPANFFLSDIMQSSESVLTNPTLQMPRPIFSSAANTVAKPSQPGSMKRKDRPASVWGNVSKRVQHDYYSVTTDLTDTESVPESRSKQQSTSQASPFKWTGVIEYAADGNLSSAWPDMDRKATVELVHNTSIANTQYMIVENLPLQQQQSPTDPSIGQEEGSFISFCARHKVHFNCGLRAAVNERNRQDVSKIGPSAAADRIAQLVRDSECIDFTILFDSFTLSVSSPLATAHANFFNSILAKLQQKHKCDTTKLSFYLFTLPAIANEPVAATQAAKPIPKDPQQNKQNPEKRVRAYWQELDKLLDPCVTVLFGGLYTDDGQSRPNTEASQLRLLGQHQLLQQRRKILLENLFGPLVLGSPLDALSGADSIPCLEAYAGHPPAIAQIVEGIFYRIDPSMVRWPLLASVRLRTALEYLRAPFTYNDTLALRSALLALFQGNDRMADELHFVATQFPSRQLRQLLVAPPTAAIHKLLDPSQNLLHRVTEAIAFLDKGIASTALRARELRTELQPLFQALSSLDSLARATK